MNLQPSPQFVQKLESELRLLYRQQLAEQPPKLVSWKNFFRLFIPTLSGSVALILILFNFVFKSAPTGGLSDQAARKSVISDETVTDNTPADEAKPMQELANYFNSDEMNQIDQGVMLAVAK